MFHSKSRSGSFRFGQKNHSSVLTRTISSKLCRDISQVDTRALISVDEKPSKFSNLSESHATADGSARGELRRTKWQLGATEKERDRTLDELEEMKKVAHEANMRLNEALSARKAKELSAELKTMKELLSNSEQELKLKEKNIDSLKVELEEMKQFEPKLAQRDALVDRLKEDLSKAKASEDCALDSLSESEKRIQELEAEREGRKLSESKMINLMAAQMKNLEQTKSELKESKLEIASLHEKIEKLEISCKQISRDLNGNKNGKGIDFIREALESLKSELQFAKENLARAQEGEKIALAEAKTLLDEKGLLKNELKLAIEAEEKSKKAMDDLALALKEVATEANQAKEKLSSTQMELEQVKVEAAQLRLMERSTEEKYQKLLDEAKKESEMRRNTADRLRLEAEETLLAWNGKEVGLVSCIKKAEEERASAIHEKNRLTESLKSSENTNWATRQENYKLRDILKQALNESNVTKEAASIARAENSHLKDCIAEKDEALHFLTRENERLRINETAANENVKGLKRLLSTGSTESKTEDKEQGGMFKSENSTFEDNKLKKAFSFNISELKLLNGHEAEDGIVVDEDPEKAEALKGSIFDTPFTPKSEPRTPKSKYQNHRRSSSAFTDSGGIPNSEDFDESDDRNSSSKRRALLRRFSDLMTMKGFYKREPSTE
ncbi:unnamed protein product [Ilex paraguariensis]|uniref:Uncharacterized protein n=1 Tax=Ilex paraguariensis TaxID=185542 RepID=A0ABC8UIZ0_9AQUA